ncbi:hypothetical protein KKF34_13785 [Myxococcota bacterium]|nr:hypothetical protein [Myxococcota bacterium]MBU1382496.1 hypothetical protein [Myxococcota bacterium]MBU1497942.1 hypothetical protein [Myxococcota bacterium]
MISNYVLDVGQGFSICGINIINEKRVEGIFNGITPAYAEKFRVNDFSSSSCEVRIFLEKSQRAECFNNDPLTRVHCNMDGPEVVWSTSSWCFRTNENYTEFYGFYRDTVDGWFGAVRAALALHLIYEEKGVLLHASSGFFNDRIYIIIGRSGAGKTTAIKNFPGIVIQDEITGLRVDSELRAWPTPFGGELEKGSDHAGKVIFVTLDKTDIDSVGETTANHFLPLSQSTVFPGGPEEINSKFLKLIEKIVDSSILIPVCATMNSGFWYLLKDLA